jgi:hypothetical protein
MPLITEFLQKETEVREEGNRWLCSLCWPL